jgi:hypothetical protein
MTWGPSQAGFGSSSVCEGFQRHGFDYVGFDAIPAAVRTQASRHPSHAFIVADARHFADTHRHVLAELFHHPSGGSEPICVDVVFDKVVPGDLPPS